MVEYDRSAQAAAATELGTLPPGSVLPRFMTDYGALRAMARACAGTAR